MFDMNRLSKAVRPMRVGRVRYVLCALLILSFIASVSAQQLWAAIGFPVVSILCALYTALIRIGGALALLVFVLAGAEYIYARAEPAKRKQAVTIMIHCVLALLIIGIAKGVVENVITEVGIVPSALVCG